MSRILIALILLLVTSCNSKAQVAMTTEQQLDSLCQAMSDEYRLSIPMEITDGTDIIAKNERLNNSFISYLHNAYYTSGKKTLTAVKKQVESGKLLRLAEGKLAIEEVEDFRNDKYIAPVDMVETEYFFLDGKLIKVSVTFGRTDYNALPRNYWIMVNQIDFVYNNTKLAKATIYHVNNHIPLTYRSILPTNVMSNDEWREMVMNYANITEEKLRAKAYELHTMYTINKNLFGY